MERKLSRDRRRGRRQADRPGPRPQLHLGRLVLLVLVLVAAAFYLGPLRQFFAEQDRYQQKTTALQAARADNAELKNQIQLFHDDSYIGEQALAGAMLVPPDTQVFVLNGLPGREDEDESRERTSPSTGSFSVFDRLEDLWRTLSR